MAIITKELRVSDIGVDIFNSVATFQTWFNNSANNTSDDIILEVEGGSSWGKLSVNAFGRTFGKTLTIRTKPSERVSLGIAKFTSGASSALMNLASSDFDAGEDPANFVYIVEGLKLATDHEDGYIFDFAGSTIRSENCVIASQGYVTEKFIYYTGWLDGLIVMKNCIICLSWDNGYASSIVVGVAKASNISDIYNCVFVMNYTGGSGTITLTFANTNKIRKCVFHNYTAKTIVVDGVTYDELNTFADPLCTEQMCVTANEPATTIIGRDFRQMGGSPLINAADPVYATSTDIYGTVRT